MAKKEKFYVVWEGKKPGIYNAWTDCKAMITGYQGAKYKSFPTFAEAKKAYNGNPADYRTKKKTPPAGTNLQGAGAPNYNSIAVDAASSGNPGIMEYRGVDTRSKKEFFHQGPFKQGTNNIGEFLALVHGLAFLKKHDSDRILYSDSRTAMSWVRKKRCNTTLKETSVNKPIFELIHRAETWLKNNDYHTTIVKWETKVWGEIPADFGRK